MPFSSVKLEPAVPSVVVTASSPREAGFDFAYETGDGYAWATLVLRSNPHIRVARYGRGRSEQDAAARAEERWRQEQADGAPPEPRRLP